MYRSHFPVVLTTELLSMHDVENKKAQFELHELSFCSKDTHEAMPLQIVLA
jgi:hypothetical protein